MPALLIRVHSRRGPKTIKWFSYNGYFRFGPKADLFGKQFILLVNQSIDEALTALITLRLL